LKPKTRSKIGKPKFETETIVLSLRRGEEGADAGDVAPAKSHLLLRPWMKHKPRLYR
jgi:hypothetical protein